MNLRGSLLRSNHGPRTALGRDGRIASGLAEGRPPLNGRTHLGTIRPSPFILPSVQRSESRSDAPLPIPRLRPSPGSRPAGLAAPRMELSVSVQEGALHLDEKCPQLDGLAVHCPVVRRVGDERLVEVTRHTAFEHHRRERSDWLELHSWLASL